MLGAFAQNCASAINRLQIEDRQSEIENPPPLLHRLVRLLPLVEGEHHLARLAAFV